MATGFLVRLRPTGPWRIGPDSGARDRVETIYHSDSMYSAVTSAMVRLGMLEDWLAATAGNAATSTEGSAVRFSSCYPFQRKTLFVVPPQSVWPPPPSAKLRYKGARFVPLSLVSSLLADQPLDESRWLLDGASECLLPSDRNEGPFRVVLRTAAAVDRVTPGACEVHTTACLEFAPACGLWFLVGFASPEARSRWSGPVKTALRLLADSGFGGERSQGWGRSETPEFIDGDLKHLMLPPRRPKPVVLKAAVIEPPPVAESTIPSRDREGAVAEETETTPEPLADARGSETTSDTPIEPESPEPNSDPEGAVIETAPTEPESPEPNSDPEEAVIETAPTEPESPEPNSDPEGAVIETAPTEPESPEPNSDPEEAVIETAPTEPESPEPSRDREGAVAEETEPAPPAEEPSSPAEEEDVAEQSEPVAEEPEPVETGPLGWWMLSLFSPGAADQVDWTRGRYTLVVRSGRIDSAARHGDLKTPASMILEGSVLVAEAEPHGSARDVAPEGFPHPVYRAGFALAIPIPLRGTP